MPGKHLLSRLLAVLLLAGTAAIPAQQDLPCAPFRDGRVDPRLVAIMLAAAEHGHLYRVDPAPSRIGFCADSHFMHIEGYFREFQGGMALHPHEDAAEQMMVLVHTDSLATSPAFVENMLKFESFFNTPVHPDILFSSTGFHWLSASMARGTEPAHAAWRDPAGGLQRGAGCTPGRGGRQQCADTARRIHHHQAPGLRHGCTEAGSR
jgi:polyisoprenoid-binding protein YceI